MTLKQPNSNAVWTEPTGSGVAAAIDAVHFVDDGLGGYKIESVTLHNATAARMLADADGFTVTDGDTNPSALAELRMIDLGGTIGIITYE